LHRIGHQQGLTLVELLITTSIVGMIMLGMVSIDYALRSNEQQQSRTSLVALRTSAMMFEITNEASQAFGDLATHCIQIGSILNNNTNYVCVYQDTNGNASSDLAADSTGDRWVCFSRQTTDLHKCTFQANDGPTHCQNGQRLTDRVIGTVTADIFEAPDTPAVTNDSTNLNIYFQITIKNRYNPTDPSAAGAEYRDTLAQEYQTNPKLLVTSQVTPIGCVP
jgi:prepilin-type N-terminal cleavage/methylation domain-containing protein